jgi:hypothetical protein
MTPEAERVDVRTIPGLSRLVEDATRTSRPQVIERDGKAVALLVPLGSVRADRLQASPEKTNVRRPVRYRSFDEFLQDRETSSQLFSWEEIEKTVDQDRVRTWRSKNS